MLPARPMFGRKIEDYFVHEIIGTGGFAEVYRATCKTNNIEVAIKMIDRKVMEEKGMRNRVKQEIDIHFRLKNPSILELYEAFDDGDYVYLVLELCREGELQKFLVANGPLPEELAKQFFKHVVDGVLYLHKHNIVHRDISLKNVLLTSDMQVKIGDFGLATQLSRPDEKHMTMCGTPNFISPEVATRSSHGLETDVWSLGCMLFTLLTGNPPFEAKTVNGTLTKVVIEDYGFPDEFAPSKSARDLISKLLKKNDKDRIPLRDIPKHPFLTTLKTKTSSVTDSGIGRTLSSCNNRVRSRSEERYSKTSVSSNPKSVISDPSPRINYSNRARYERIAEVDSILSVVQQHISSQEEQFPLEVPPFNSKRLQPTRHRTKNAVLTILQSGDVYIEFIRNKRNVETVHEVCRISGDGMHVVLYKPARATEIASEPPAMPRGEADSVYSYESLPRKHHKKYIYAARFVQLVRAKTPKITLYTALAKCFFMENGPGPDCELHFYDSVEVTRVNKSVKIRSKGSVFEGEFPEELDQYYEHYQRCYQRCLLVESALVALEFSTGDSYFPAIIGRKPTTPPCFQGKENCAMSSFHATCSVVSTVASRSRFSSASNFAVPAVGMAKKFPNGIIRVEYEDGSILCVNPGGGFVHHDAFGNVINFKAKSSVPAEIKEKLRQLPHALGHLALPNRKNIR